MLDTVKIFMIKNMIKTRGQRPNESQKTVIIDMMKSVGEIASKMWPDEATKYLQLGLSRLTKYLITYSVGLRYQGSHVPGQNFDCRIAVSVLQNLSRLTNI